MTGHKRKLLVTSALPYANGSIHLGHLVEYIQTDIWVRFQKLMGNDCHYMCADDTHGTPIMLSAKRQGITPEELVAKMHREHFDDFRGFFVEFDNYYTTNSEENREFSEYIYSKAKEQGAIEKREIEQYYCESCRMFLPDRLIKGTCPDCGGEDQYGDTCEVCSSTYNPTDLIDPKCAECRIVPVIKKSVHYFFALSKFSERLKAWVAQGHVRGEIQNKLKEWFDQGLRDWDISRDAPYFGFKIPETDDKYFYVWLDAPIGYIATTKNWCVKKGVDFDEIWKTGDYEICHFIGKDILYFHALFWPAMLMVSGFKTPSKVNVHGFLTISGEKMSKSRGTFINARKYLGHDLNPEFLRYYYASKLSNSIDDLDLSPEDFVSRVNSDVVNKVVNIGSRLGSLVNKKLDGRISQPDSDGRQLLSAIKNTISTVSDFYENLEYGKAMKEIMRLADNANKYIDDKAPWNVVKENPERAAQICASGLNALKFLIGLLKPVLPRIAEGVEEFLNIEPMTFANIDREIIDHKINPYQRLAERLDRESVDRLFV